MSHCDKPSKFTRSECHNLGWIDNPSTLRQNVTVVKCHSRQFVGWTLSLGQNVAWSVRGWTDHQCTAISLDSKMSPYSATFRHPRQQQLPANVVAVTSDIRLPPSQPARCHQPSHRWLAHDLTCCSNICILFWARFDYLPHIQWQILTNYYVK